MKDVKIIHPETGKTAIITAEAWLNAGYRKRGWILADQNDSVFINASAQKDATPKVDPAQIIESAIDESITLDEPEVKEEQHQEEAKEEQADAIPVDRKCPYCGGVARSDESYTKYHGKHCRKYKGE